MKALHLVLASTILIAGICFSCNKNIAPNTPDCIRKEIMSRENDRTVGSVDEYFFQNRLVYAFSPNNTIIADGSTTIKDENCNQLCTVGGFGGPQVNLCSGENFFATAVFKRNSWKKE